jgi:hypothetical protein
MMILIIWVGVFFYLDVLQQLRRCDFYRTIMVWVFLV